MIGGLGSGRRPNLWSMVGLCLCVVLVGWAQFIQYRVNYTLDGDAVGYLECGEDSCMQVLYPVPMKN